MEEDFGVPGLGGVFLWIIFYISWCFLWSVFIIPNLSSCHRWFYQQLNGRGFYIGIYICRRYCFPFLFGLIRFFFLPLLLLLLEYPPLLLLLLFRVRVWDGSVLFGFKFASSVGEGRVRCQLRWYLEVWFARKRVMNCDDYEGGSRGRGVVLYSTTTTLLLWLKAYREQ